eukprot:3118610-Pyramimonas_sp.AAC.1
MDAGAAAVAARVALVEERAHASHTRLIAFEERAAADLDRAKVEVTGKIDRARAQNHTRGGYCVRCNSPPSRVNAFADGNRKKELDLRGGPVACARVGVALLADADAQAAQAAASRANGECEQLSHALLAMQRQAELLGDQLLQAEQALRKEYTEALNAQRVEVASKVDRKANTVDVTGRLAELTEMLSRKVGDANQPSLPRVFSPSPHVHTLAACQGWYILQKARYMCVTTFRGVALLPSHCVTYV